MKKLTFIAIMLVLLLSCKKEYNQTYCYVCTLEQGVRNCDSTLNSNIEIFDVIATQDEINNSYSFYYTNNISGSNDYTFAIQKCSIKNKLSK